MPPTPRMTTFPVQSSCLLGEGELGLGLPELRTLSPQKQTSSQPGDPSCLGATGLHLPHVGPWLPESWAWSGRPEPCLKDPEAWHLCSNRWVAGTVLSPPNESGTGAQRADHGVHTPAQAPQGRSVGLCTNNLSICLFPWEPVLPAHPALGPERPPRVAAAAGAQDKRADQTDRQASGPLSSLKSRWGPWGRKGPGRSPAVSALGRKCEVRRAAGGNEEVGGQGGGARGAESREAGGRTRRDAHAAVGTRKPQSSGDSGRQARALAPVQATALQERKG